MRLYVRDPLVAPAPVVFARVLHALEHRDPAQRSSDGAVTTATDGERVAASLTSDRRRRDFTTIRVVVEDAPPAHAARGAPVRLLDVPDRRPPAFDRGPKHDQKKCAIWTRWRPFPSKTSITRGPSVVAVAVSSDPILPHR